MTSLRHNESPGTDLRDVYLDAARACILDVGWRRTTLTEVARRAGVSRMTIYRSWADMPTLLGDLMTREWTRIAAQVGVPGQPGSPGSPGGGSAVTAIARTVVAVVEALRTNELFVRIVELDPELVLPYLLSRRGRSQDNLLALLTEAIASAQAAGAVRKAEPVLLARTLVLTAHGFVLSAHTMVDDRVALGGLDAELARLVERTLT